VDAVLRVPARVRAVSGWLALAAATALFVRAYVVDYWGYDASDLAPIAVAGALVADGQAAHLYDHDASVFNELSSPAHVERHHRLGYASDPRPFVMPPLVAWLVFGFLGVELATAAGRGTPRRPRRRSST
jgi:hypothetical protein